MLEDANLLSNDGEGGKRRTTGSSIVVDGTPFATSLFWQPIQNPNDFMPEVEDASTDIVEGADLFAVKGGKAPQFGICVSQDGYKKGMNSAAIALMTSLSDFSSIVGVFKVEGGWWYVCSRNDVILSDGDMLYTDEEEAKNQLMSMLTVPDWDKKFAPAEWELPETEEGDIETIFSKGKRVKLQKIKSLRGTKLVVVVVGGIIVGGWLLSTLFDFIMAPPKRKVVKPPKPKIVQKTEVVIPKPWENMNSPTGFMNNCYKGVIDMATLMPPGWASSGKIVCTGETVATSWKKGVGFLDWAEKTMKNSHFDNLQYAFNENGTSLSATLSLPKLNKENNAPTKRMPDLRLEINKLFQEIGVKISLSKKTIKLSQSANKSKAGKGSIGAKGPKGPPAPKGGRGKGAQTLDIQALGFKINSQYNPLTWLQLLTKFSSFEINNIEYNINNSSWAYEGVFYVL